MAGPVLQINERERRLLGDLFAIVEEHAEDALVEIDRDACGGGKIPGREA